MPGPSGYFIQGMQGLPRTWLAGVGDWNLFRVAFLTGPLNRLKAGRFDNLVGDVADDGFCSIQSRQRERMADLGLSDSSEAAERWGSVCPKQATLEPVGEYDSQHPFGANRGGAISWILCCQTGADASDVVFRSESGTQWAKSRSGILTRMLPKRMAGCGKPNLRGTCGRH